MLKKISVILLCVGLLSLQGCGFHLRSHGKTKLKGECVTVSPQNRWNPFYQKLTHRLKSYGMRLEEVADTRCSKIAYSAIEMQEQSLAFGADGQVHRNKLILSGDVVIARETQHIPFKINVQREARINPNDKLSSDEETTVIKQEMNEEAVDLIIQKLNAAYQ